MAGQLTDDGTMDTVICCSECGQEARYNYDSSARDEQDNADRIEEFAAKFPADNIMRLQERVDEQCYDEWIDWCIEDFDSEHECPAYSIQTWFERDRVHVALYFGTGHDANDDLIVEWWDEAVAEAIEDGFLNPKDYLASAIEYAQSVGLAPKGKR